MDAEGPHCEDGRVRYASKTYENLEATRKAGLNGVTMPRRFGGLNFPITAYTAINEMIASADAGFENIWSLQDCIETLYEFGDEDIDGIGRIPTGVGSAPTCLPTGRRGTIPNAKAKKLLHY